MKRKVATIVRSQVQLGNDGLPICVPKYNLGTRVLAFFLVPSSWLGKAFTSQAQLGNHFRSQVQLGNEWRKNN